MRALSVMLTIAGREAGAMLRIPAGWVIIALYLLLAGSVFANATLIPGEPASLAHLFRVSCWLLLPVVPAIAMRLVSEELRSGTIEPLMTAPVGDVSLVVGKYLGACAFLLVMIAPTLVHVGVLWHYSEPKPDAGAIAAGYASVILQAMLYLAIGTLASALTSNQTLAFLASLFFLLFLLMVSLLGGYEAPVWLQGPLRTLAIAPRLTDFAKGVIDVSHVVFFLTMTGWFLVLTYLSLGSRRWR